MLIFTSIKELHKIFRSAKGQHFLLEKSAKVSLFMVKNLVDTLSCAVKYKV